MSGGSPGSAERSRTEPRDRGASSPVTMPKTAPDSLTSRSTGNGPAANRWRSGAPSGVEERVAIAWNRGPAAGSSAGRRRRIGWSTRLLADGRQSPPPRRCRGSRQASCGADAANERGSPAAVGAGRQHAPGPPSSSSPSTGGTYSDASPWTIFDPSRSSVSERTVRLGRRRAGARWVRAALIRRPSRTLRGVGPTPAPRVVVVGDRRVSHRYRGIDEGPLDRVELVDRVAGGSGSDRRSRATRRRNRGRSRQRGRTAGDRRSSTRDAAACHGRSRPGQPRNAEAALVAEQPPISLRPAAGPAAAVVGLGDVAPVVINRRLGGIGDIGRQVAQMRIVRPGLDQQHRAALVLAQPGRHHAHRPYPPPRRPRHKPCPPPTIGLRAPVTHAGHRTPSFVHLAPA